MTDETLTNEELTAAVRSLQNERMNLLERIEALEYHWHSLNEPESLPTLPVVTPVGEKGRQLRARSR